MVVNQRANGAEYCPGGRAAVSGPRRGRGRRGRPEPLTVTVPIGMSLHEVLALAGDATVDDRF